MDLEDKKHISVVVPVFNEEGNVIPLFNELKGVLDKLKYSYEIIFVNDGSFDNTLPNLYKLKPIKIINFRKNFGQTYALDAGIKNSKGDIIITLDGDMQNDPKDIPFLIEKMNENYDVVSGWRINRKDPLSKKISSFFANFFIRLLIKEKIHDSGCSIKAYKKICFEDLDLFGEIHRFIPSILRWQGFKITEIKVNHRERKNGKTKYGFFRIIKGFLDLLSLWFWRKYSGRPLHFFGGIGLFLVFIGFFMMLILVLFRILEIMSLKDSILPLFSFFTILMGINFFTSGLIMDVNIKNYYKLKKGNYYNIKEITENI